ncbi:MAG TPA: NADPH-dependent FMN reductase [Chloroflexota bacterium]|nr:NADPH-dependent FMN reductase [Chloroflexota bacterium]
MHLLLISGSTRAGSTNTAVLRTAGAVVPSGVTSVLYTGLATLPAFNPDDDFAPLPSAVADLRQHIAAADAVLFCTPEYAGALPGSFKNLLDWTVGGGELYGKHVAWINAASLAAPTRATDAHASLARVLGYVGAVVVEPACARISVGREVVGTDGQIGDPAIRTQIADVLETLVQHLSATGSGSGESLDER